MVGEEGCGQDVKGLVQIEDRVKIWSELRVENQFIDAVLVCSDGVSFPVHRVILSGCSKFFRALFTNPMRLDEQNRVNLQNVNSSEMGVLLRYVYDRTLDITNENVFKLLEVSDYLWFLDVRKACEEFLKQSLTAVNCLTIRVFARNHFLEDLEGEAQMYLLRNFPLIAETSAEILSLPLDELVPILANDRLNVRNEEVVWKLVLRWIDHDKENRLQHLMALLRCIRLGLMEVQYLLDNVKYHPYILGNEVCRPVIRDALKVLLDTQKDVWVQNYSIFVRVLPPEVARPRIPHEVLFAIGGWSGGGPTSAVETYDTREDKWIRVEERDPSGPRAYHGTAVIGFNIYVIGGLDGRDHLTWSCRCFNAQLKSWKKIASMHERRGYVSVVVLDDIVYAMGGDDDRDILNTVEKYDYKTNQWTMINPMHVQRSDACATVLNGKIYITGGFDGRKDLRTAEVYDPATNTWTRLPPMRSRRSGASCITYHDSIYVLGGFNGVSRMCSAEMYSPTTNLWTAIPDMYTTRSNFASVVIDDMVFAIGGFNGIDTIHQVEFFDDRTYEWYKAADMNVSRSALSACVVADLPNTNDFIYQNNRMLMENLLALSQTNNTAANNDNNPAIANITQAIEEVNNAVNNNMDAQEPQVPQEDANVAMD